MNIKHSFPCMKNKGKWIGVAFRYGDWYNPYEALIMGSTLGSLVHCELIIGENSQGNVYSSYNNEHVNSGCTRSIENFNTPKWLLLTQQVIDTTKSQAHILTMLENKLQYNVRDLWQCCVKTMLPFEQELDCDMVETWKPHGVFCSQMCLLFLRHAARVGELPVTVHLKHNLENVHSRGCSPNLLYHILSPFFVKSV